MVQFDLCFWCFCLFDFIDWGLVGLGGWTAEIIYNVVAFCGCVIL